MEAVGLGVGVVGLAGLFSACIDCFELVQRGRYHGKDFLLLETKFTNQRLRLKTWGRACGFTDAGAGDADDDFGDAEVRSSIETTLAHLLTLFRDGRVLTTKYGLKRDQNSQGRLAIGSGRIGAMVSDRLSSSKLGQRLQELGDNVHKTQKEAKVISKARWAIEDKAKFAELVQHLKDLIDDLEGLTRWLPVADRQQKIVQWEVESITDIDTLETMEEARVGRTDIVSDAASIRLWELRDRFLEDGPERTPTVTRRSSQISAVSSEDPWHDVGQDSWRPPDSVGHECYRVLHKVTCPHTTTAFYLNAPSYDVMNDDDHQWMVLDDRHPTANMRALHLCGRRPIYDLEAFLAKHHKLSFVVFQNYRCDHDGTKQDDQRPTSFTQSIYLWSQRLCDDLKSVLCTAQPLQITDFLPRTELQAPHLWLYQSRHRIDALVDANLKCSPVYEDIKSLLLVASTAMVDEYNEVDSLISKGLMSWKYLRYVFVRTSVVFRRADNSREFYHANEVLSLSFGKGDEGTPSLTLKVQCYRFDGTFQKAESTWTFSQAQFVNANEAYFLISSMPVRTLEHASHEIGDYLVDRGRGLWECRRNRLINYTGADAASAKHYDGQRFKIDTALYHRLHPKSPQASSVRKRNHHGSRDEGSKDFPTESFLLLLPPTLYGYDMVDNQWVQLLVSNITPVIYDKRLFDYLVLPAEDKDLILAMASSYGTSDARSTDRPRRGFGGYLLLHGGPGSGKTVTAEAIAETTERPLFRISLSNIGTDPVAAQQYLRTVAAMCNTWDCVVLLNGADIFLEQRRGDTMGQSVMGVAIMEALDTFTCMMIFITDRVGTFDETFRSRCQLAVHFERPDRAARRKIWRNFFEKIRSETNQTDDFEETELFDEAKEFAEWELNGMQIRNVIIMATQLAYAKNQHLSPKHINLVYMNSQRFKNYLTQAYTHREDGLYRDSVLR